MEQINNPVGHIWLNFIKLPYRFRSLFLGYILKLVMSGPDKNGL